MSLGAKIKKIREENRLTQKELAKIVGVTDKAVSLWEQDKRDPRMGPMQKMSKHFGIRLSELLEEFTEDSIPYSPVAVSIPIIDFIPSENSIISSDKTIGSEIVSPQLKSDNTDLVFYKVGSSSPSHLFCEGDLVLISFKNTVTNGSIALVSVDDSLPVIKRLYCFEDKVVLKGRTSLGDRVFKGDELSRLKVLGQVLRIIKDC